MSEEEDGSTEEKLKVPYERAILDEQIVMTDEDFVKALEALKENEDNEVGELLKLMNENRIISWEEAEQILGDTGNVPVKSSLPEQTRPTEPDNDTNVDECIQRLLDNDPKLTEINLNNMKRTPIPQIKRLVEAVAYNTYLEKLSLANLGLYDTNLEALPQVIELNSTLKSLNLETNYLSGDFFAKLFKASLTNQTLEEVKAVNQGVSFATTAEKEIIESIVENRGLIKVSVNLRLPEGRHKIENTMLRNGEIKRVLRREAAAQAKAEAEAAAAKATIRPTAKKPVEPYVPRPPLNTDVRPKTPVTEKATLPVKPTAAELRAAASRLSPVPERKLPETSKKVADNHVASKKDAKQTVALKAGDASEAGDASDDAKTMKTAEENREKSLPKKPTPLEPLEKPSTIAKTAPKPSSTTAVEKQMPPKVAFRKPEDTKALTNKTPQKEAADSLKTVAPATRKTPPKEAVNNSTAGSITKRKTPTKDPAPKAAVTGKNQPKEAGAKSTNIAASTGKTTSKEVAGKSMPTRKTPPKETIPAKSGAGTAETLKPALSSAAITRKSPPKVTGRPQEIKRPSPPKTLEEKKLAPKPLVIPALKSKTDRKKPVERTISQDKTKEIIEKLERRSSKDVESFGEAAKKKKVISKKPSDTVPKKEAGKGVPAKKAPE